MLSIDFACLTRLAAICLATALAFPAIAGPSDDANTAYASGDYAAALRLWRELAEKGDASAQSRLGVMYRDGRGVARDDQQAVEWFRKAAEQGNAFAQADLGVMYQNGRGVPRDDQQAIEWYRKAAEQGNPGAQNNLGSMYGTGRGIAKDDVQAEQWYRKAAEQGNAVGQCNLASMYKDARGGLQQDDKLAVDWYRKAADQGNPIGQRNLGAMYHEGRGVAKDDAAAVQWLQKAAKQGDASAKTLLASIEPAQTELEKIERTLRERESNSAVTPVEQAVPKGVVPATKAGSAGQDGLVIIHVDIARLNNAGETSWIEGAAGYHIKNLVTGREYGSSLSRSGVDAREVEEGIYCLDSVKGGPNSVEMQYCREPFFTVAPGKVNNAGWWRIGYQIKSGPSFTGTVQLGLWTQVFQRGLYRRKEI